MQQVSVNVFRQVIPTYPQPDAEELPIFAENRVHQRSTGRPYPNKVVLGVCHDKKIDKEYTVVRLENELISVDILPEIGGRVFAARDKATGYDFFYHQHVIKPALIGVLGSWISGGIEFNWPFHHRASGFMPCDFTTETLPDGSALCRLSEHDPIDRMKGMVSIVLRPGCTYLETRVELYNRTELPKSFLWWENAAVPVNENYRIFFPKDVTYVSFHYLKSRAAFPVADNCVYNGIDIRKPTDISLHKNTRDATSYFSAASKYDFFGGYDDGKQCGVVHIADHQISPGKKMFTWGYNQLSRSWENALTDTDGAYAELMAGSYSDNQPNFSWLKPYETKRFSQYWFPISKIGAPDFANLHGAVSLRKDEGKTCFQFTEGYDDLRLEVTCGGKSTSVTAAHAEPGEVLCVEAALAFPAAVKAYSGNRLLMDYTEEEPDRFATPDPIEDTPQADSLNNVRSLYLAGLHVDQYRDPAVYPDVYWKKALNIDPKHIPSLTAMAAFCYRYCRFDEALCYIERAWEAQTLFNARPMTGEIPYLRGLIYEALHEYGKAYDSYAAAAWDGDSAGRAMTRMAMLDLRVKDADKALEHSENALRHGADNVLAQAVRLFALQMTGAEPEPVADPFAYIARLAMGEAPEAIFARMSSDPAQTTLDMVWELSAMGMEEKAPELLDRLTACRPEAGNCIVCFTAAYLKKKLGRNADDSLAAAEKAPVGAAFPNRREELDVLRTFAPVSEKAAYLLGCLCYSKKLFDEARSVWSGISRSFADHGAVCRCLAMLEFNHGDRKKALPLMTEALAAAPTVQMLYESVILLDKLNAPAEDKLNLLKQHEDLICRDDLFTELAKAYNQHHEPQAALKVLEGHDFVPCEGGEHAIADQYMLAYFMIGRKLMKEQDYGKALEAFRSAQVLPQHLGAGIWNRCRLVPHRFFEAVCLDQLGQKAQAEEILTDITGIKIDYFSNMHLKELPFYQACAYRMLGRPMPGTQLMTEYRRKWTNALSVKDSGYFATTPFFLPFTEKAEDLRTAQFSYLLGLNALYRGETAEAKVLLDKASSLNSELYYADIFSDFCI